MRSLRSILCAARRSAASAALLAALSASRFAAAQVSPHGPEFQVNTYTTGAQFTPAVTSDSQGNFIVAWTSWGSGGSDTSYTSIQAQRFDARGGRLGAQFQVNSETTDGQVGGAVATDAQGNFVVAWENQGSIRESLRAQRFDAGGNPLGSEFQVDSYTPGRPEPPEVAADPQGNLLVVWQSLGSPGNDSESIQARRFDAGGTAQGPQFQVNTYTTSLQWFPRVAADGTGNFVVVWMGYGSAGSDTDGWSIHAQRYDGGGNPIGSEFQVNTYTTNDQTSPAVAAEGDGGFVVVWDSWGSAGTDTSYQSIQAQRFDANGEPIGSQFQVNVYTTSHQAGPHVAADGRGRFVISWTSSGSSGSDTSGFSIQARRFPPDGSALTADFQVNSYPTGDQSRPAVAADPRGNFVVTWDSAGSAGPDSDSESIQAQRFDELFRDGFESGGTSRWSQASP